MKTRVAVALVIATAGSVLASAQLRKVARTPWGDPDLQGHWTSEGEYSVPFERPAPLNNAHAMRRLASDNT